MSHLLARFSPILGYLGYIFCSFYCFFIILISIIYINLSTDLVIINMISKVIK
jgi:hypothetical protein